MDNATYYFKMSDGNGYASSPEHHNNYDILDVVSARGKNYQPPLVRIRSRASKTWYEDAIGQIRHFPDTSVKLPKDIHECPLLTLAELKEFMWVKLQAQEL